MKVVLTENKFTLRNFDKWLSGTLIKRGKQYFENGAVIALDDDAGNWTAAVEGSEIYEVSVKLKNDEEIADNFCDCPFEGDVCKHQVKLIIETTQRITKDYGKHNWVSLNNLFLNSREPIYIEEGLVDRLWDLVKNENDLNTIMVYQNHLIPVYSVELLKLYLPALEHQGDKASGRSDYAHLAKNMKKIIKDIPAGKEQLIAVARRLKTKYPRRPAMIDELNSVLV